MKAQKNNYGHSCWLPVSVVLFAMIVLGGTAGVAVAAFPGDINGDGGVDLDDLYIMTTCWLDNNCVDVPPGNLDTDCDVDFEDYSILAKDWLEGLPEFIGTTYYVATTGSNANPGTAEQPWATIQKAANTMVAGDRVIVRPGTYNEEVTPANSGSLQGCGLGDVPITYFADPSGEVIINATGKYFGFYVAKACIVIDGFKIIGALSAGIDFDMNASSYGTVRNCEIYNSADGIDVLGGDGVKIENCLIYNNTYVGILVAGTSKHLQVSNCDIYHNDIGFWYPDIGCNGTITDCIITNNITCGVQSDASYIVKYCDVWGNGTNYNGGVSAGTGCKIADPCYVNPPSDFHLGVGSPCIGTGSGGNDMGYYYPPLANAGQDRSVYAENLVTFDGSESRGDLVSYTWDFDDSEVGYGDVVTHTYATPGTYTVTLTVSDGYDTDEDTCIIQVMGKRIENVYHVTSLADTVTAGTFRHCLSLANSDGTPSRIVFDVNGVINATAGYGLSEPNTTICGTEAPGNGITFDFGTTQPGFSVDSSNNRFCNLSIIKTKIKVGGVDGIGISGSKNVVERCSFNLCTDEGVGITGSGARGNVVAFCRITNCGSQTSPYVDGRGILVTENSSAVIAGNYVTHCRAGIQLNYVDGFMDCRNNLVEYNLSNYGISIVGSTGNVIDNLIISNAGDGLKVFRGDIPVYTEFYRHENEFISDNQSIGSGVVEVYNIITRADTPFPNWLENIMTPDVSTDVGKGTGRCQCVACE